MNFCVIRRCGVFAASDAHGGFHVGKRGVVKAPSYEDAFSLAGLGVDRAYADDPLRAIRGGDFFVCVRGAGEPGDFILRRKPMTERGSGAGEWRRWAAG